MDKFASITDFTKLKKECVFCGEPLRVVLTNFVGLREKEIPIVKAPLIDNKFNFRIEHTTSKFDIKADVVVNAAANVLLFDNYTNGELPAVDEYMVSRTFVDYRLHVEMYCTSRKCGLMYHLSSHPLWLDKIPSVKGAWSIKPFGLLWEGAKVNHYVIHNDWESQKTSIYTLKNEMARPIETSMIDFSKMDKTKLTNRVQMLVVFS